MEITAAQIAAIMEEHAPLAYQETYDNAGFCVGNPEARIDSVLLCVDVTEDVMNEAIKGNFQMIISHHPVIFGGLKQLTGKNYVERIVAQAIKHDITLYAAHTNMDVAVQGVSWRMAKKLGLQHIEVLSLRENLAQGAGFGTVGDLPKPLAGTDFFDLLKQTFDAACLRHSPLFQNKIHRIALCGGSGSFLLHDAIATGAQCFVSADFKYHDFFNADGRIIMIDIGHYESEKCILSTFYDILLKKIPNFVVRISEKGINPVHYY